MREVRVLSSASVSVIEILQVRCAHSRAGVTYVFAMFLAADGLAP